MDDHDDAPDPLAEMLEACTEHGRPSLAWVTAHVPDGDLGAAVARLWLECRDPRAMLRLAADSAPRTTIVLAACACARAVADLLPEDVPEPARAVETAERWARGAASPEACAEAASEAYDCDGCDQEADEARNAAVYAADSAAEACGVNYVRWSASAAGEAAEHAAHALAWVRMEDEPDVEENSNAAYHRVLPRCRAEIAALVRARVEAPRLTLEDCARLARR